MDEYYSMFWALYYSNDRSVVMHKAWSIIKEYAVTNSTLCYISSANINKLSWVMGDRK